MTPGVSAVAPNGLAPARDVTFVIFLGNRSTNPDRFSPPLARVGTLPILLRTILAAQKTDPAEIVVVVDPTTKQSVQANLRRTGRLPGSVRWIEVQADASAAERLRLVVSQTDSQRLVLVDGGTTYHPSVGANLVWPVALYSSNIFAGVRRAAVVAPMAAE